MALQAARASLQVIEEGPDVDDPDVRGPAPPRLSAEEIAALHRLIDTGRLPPEALGLPGLARASGHRRPLTLALGLVVWAFAFYGAWSLMG